MRKFIFKFGFLWFVLLLISNLLTAQTDLKSVKGQVLNLRSFQPLENVRVYALLEVDFEYLDEQNTPTPLFGIDTLQTVVTNQNGEFFMDSLQPLDLVFSFTMEGFDELRQDVSLTNNSNADFMVLLKPVDVVNEQVFYSLQGYVQDAVSFLPVSNAQVKIETLNEPFLTQPLSTVSNEEGFFIFQNIPKPLILLSIEHGDFQQFTSNLNLTSQVAGDVMVLLRKNEVRNLPLVTISERKIERTPYVSNLILANEFEQNAISDIGDYLRSIPNVSGIRKGGANVDPVIRGFKYSQLNVVINGAQGVEGGCPNRMDPATSRSEVEDLERIEVYKGPYALRFGTALGGTINLITQRPTVTESPKISVRGLRGYESNWNGHKEHISVKGSNEHAFFLASGSRWNYGNYQDGNGNYIRSSFSKYNFGGLIGANYLKHEFVFSVRQSFNKVLFPALPMDEVDDNSSLLFTEYKFTPQNEFFKELSLKGYQSNIHHIMDNMNRPFSDTVATVSDVVALTTGAKAETLLGIMKGNLIIGLDYQNRQKNGQRTKNMIMQPQLPVKVENLWNDAVINNYGAYFEYAKAFAKYDLVLAARYDLNIAESDIINLKNTQGISILNISDTKSTYNNFSFSGGLTRHFGTHTSLSLSVGRVSRSPDMLERFIILLPVGYDPYDYLGNPKLLPEINNQVDFTFRNNSKWGGFELNFFYAFVENFIYGRLLPSTVQKPFTIGVLGVKEFYNAADVNISGVEAAYQSPEDYNLQIDLTAAYAQATLSSVTKYIRQNNQVVDEELIQNDPLNEIPPFEGRLNIAYRIFNKRLIPSASLRMVASQNKISEVMYEQKTPGFTLFNASLTYKHNNLLSLTGGVNNILDKAYYEHLNRRVIGSNLNIYEPGRVFFVNLIINL
ncbi:MAG: TonB-dependent receptor [Bacteroidales bacterium]|nr:TonB-dependent receptor [Bacteroidales bacterium]